MKNRTVTSPRFLVVADAHIGHKNLPNGAAHHGRTRRVTEHVGIGRYGIFMMRL